MDMPSSPTPELSPGLSDVDGDGFRHRPDGRAPNVDEGSVPVFAVRPSKVLSFDRGVGFVQTRYRPWG